MLLAMASCWPMLLMGGPLLFHDSASYLDQGGRIAAMLAPADAGGGGEGGGAAGAGGPAGGKALRSAPYALFVHLATLTPLGLAGPTLAQSALVAALALMLMMGEQRAPRRDVALAAAAMVGLTTWPWFASYLMPDLLAAAAVLYAAVLARSFDALDWPQRLGAGGVATFAILSHYGHLPLAAGCIAVALGLRWLDGRLGLAVIAAGAAPIALALAINVGGSSAVLEGPSVAPMRLPVLLARSIEDGPARWHLQRHCAEERYAICEIAPALPERVGQFLFGPDGLRGATPAQMARVRAEETTILWRAFREYPVAQTWSLIGNAVTQLGRIGADDFLWGRIETNAEGELRLEVDRDRDRRAFDMFAALNAAAALIAAAAIAVMAARDGLRVGAHERALLVVVVAGLLLNAAIFGGLSAPADRYQGRVAWLIPLLAALFWLARRRAAADAATVAPAPPRSGPPI